MTETPIGTTDVSTPTHIAIQLRKAIQTLKNVAPHYAALDEGQQKDIRSTLYREEGAFAKVIMQGDKSPITRVIKESKRLGLS